MPCGHVEPMFGSDLQPHVCELPKAHGGAHQADYRRGDGQITWDDRGDSFIHERVVIRGDCSKCGGALIDGLDVGTSHAVCPKPSDWSNP